MRGKKRMLYTDASLNNALKAINDKVMSVRKASIVYGVPKSTLLDKIKNKYSHQLGAPTTLTIEEEKKLVKWIIDMGERGFPVTKNQLVESVAKLVQNLERPNPFKNGIPGKKWVHAFLKRNCSISRRISQPLSTSRAIVTEEGIRSWFSRVRCYLKDNGLLRVMDDPRRIFNSDESGFYLTPKDNYVLARKGARKVYSRVYNDEKECLTTLITVCADGSSPPPMVLYPYKLRIPANIDSKYPKNWGIGRSESGWMTSEVFFEYVANVLYPWIQKNEIPLPVIYFVDGHTSHLNIHVLEFCKEKGIILTAFYPNATHILQPLDVGVFRPLKLAWKNEVQNWRMKNCGERMKREEFAGILKSAIDTAITSKIVKHAFHTCGLYPMNEENIKYDKYVKQLDDTNNSEKNDRTTNSNTKALEGTVGNMSDKEFLSTIEENIDPSLVAQFKTTESEWEGDLSDLSLFKLWRKIANRIKNTTIYNDAECDLQVCLIEETSIAEELWTNNTIDAIVDNNGALNIIEEISEESTQISPQKSQDVSVDMSSPFKKSLYWPDKIIKKRQTSNSSENPKKKRKVTPVVAINSEFLEYQRNIQAEKELKEKTKLERSTRKKIARNDSIKTIVEITEEPTADLYYLPGSFVIIKYEGELYPGTVIESDIEVVKVKTMSMSMNNWRWPEKEDVCEYSREDIICKIPVPELINNRGIYSVPEINELRDKIKAANNML